MTDWANYDWDSVLADATAPAGGNNAGAVDSAPGAGGWFGEVLGGLVNAGTQIGLGWLQTEAYKDALKDQVQIQTLQNQLQNSQNNSTASNAVGSGGGATASPFNWKPWAIGGGVIVAALVVLKMVK